MIGDGHIICIDILRNCGLFAWGYSDIKIGTCSDCIVEGLFKLK